MGVLRGNGSSFQRTWSLKFNIMLEFFEHLIFDLVSLLVSIELLFEEREFG